jgi:hypothetical protein
VLVDSERLAGNGRLIDLEEGVFGDNATIGRNNCALVIFVSGRIIVNEDMGVSYFFNLENITGDDLWSLNLLELAVTENGGFESKSLLQFFDNGTGLVFLDETDASVEQEQSANNTEVDPVLKTSSENRSSLVLVSIVLAMPIAACDR